MRKEKMRSSKNVLDARNVGKSLGNKKLTSKKTMTRTYEANNWNPALTGRMGKTDFNHGKKKDPAPKTLIRGKTKRKP